MNKKSVRAFGIALFLAGASMSLVEMLSIGNNTDSESLVAPKGYELVKKEDLTSLKEEAKDAKEQLANVQLDLKSSQEANTNKEENQEEKNSGDSSAFKLVVEQGMNSTDVSQALQDAGIIQNKKDFDQYLADQGLSSKIQIGEFEVNSSMTMKELANVLTSQ